VSIQSSKIGAQGEREWGGGVQKREWVLKSPATIVRIESEIGRRKRGSSEWVLEGTW
jgi:hypothetical protein